MDNKFKVKTPIGYFMVEEKGAEYEYPGVYISFSIDGEKYDVSNMIACVEYDSFKKQIKTTTYIKDEDCPIHDIDWKDGNDYIIK